MADHLTSPTAHARTKPLGEAFAKHIRNEGNDRAEVRAFLLNPENQHMLYSPLLIDLALEYSAELRSCGLPTDEASEEDADERPLLSFTVHVTSSNEYRVDVEARDGEHAEQLVREMLDEHDLPEIGEWVDNTTDIWDVSPPMQWQTPDDTDPTRETRET